VQPARDSLRFVVCRPRSTRQFFSTTAPFRTSPHCSSHPLIRYDVSLGENVLTQSGEMTFDTQSSVTSVCPALRLISSPLQVRMQALKCFSVLAYENTQVSMTLVNGEEISPSVHFLPFFLRFSLNSGVLPCRCQCWWMASCLLRYLLK